MTEDTLMLDAVRLIIYALLLFVLWHAWKQYMLWKIARLKQVKPE